MKLNSSNECPFCNECPCICEDEKVEIEKINIENLIRLEMAQSVLRQVLSDPSYEIKQAEIRKITQPLAELIRKILEERSEQA